MSADRPREAPDASYEAAVRALFARQPNRMVPDLDRIRSLCELLGGPEQAYPSIQLTGTNGKTSCVRMIAALLGALGLKPGQYTSPHLQEVRERIRVADELIPREDLLDRLEHLTPFVAEVDARHPDAVTFFEVLTALAAVHFAEAAVDVGVFEVGLGGRWDATNLVRGEVAVLTEVSLDHPELGDTVEQVAEEKAGIIKDGAVVVTAEQPAPVREQIAETAARRGARLVSAGEDFGVLRRKMAVGGQLVDLRGVTGEVTDVLLPLHGAHQAENAACALAAVEGFLGFAGGIDPEVIREGFAAVTSPGRLEVVRRIDGAPVILDGAHNPAAARRLAAALREEFAVRSRVVILGVLGDKDVEGIVTELLSITDHLVVTEPPSSRAAPAERVAKPAREAGRSVEVAADLPTAIELASGVASEEDAIVVAGSLYTVGAARDALGLEPG